MADRQAAHVIHAAGGVVWRVTKGKVEVALVHRPQYDDWTLPKGKLHSGEAELAAAVREVREELGSQVAVSRRMSRVSYYAGPTRKRVTYWVMRHLSGSFEPNAEIDRVDWLTPKQARTKLTYPVDREVMVDFAAVPIAESVIVLVRHARAGKRSEWRGPDDMRPLDSSGRMQAKRLVPFLTCFAPDHVISAEPVRCVETIRPLADALHTAVTIDPAFGDASYEVSPATAETALYALAKPNNVSVVCSQGVTIPGLIDRVTRGLRPSDTRKGAAWVLSLVDGTVVSADYYDAAAR